MCLDPGLQLQRQFPPPHAGSVLAVYAVSPQPRRGRREVRGGVPVCKALVNPDRFHHRLAGALPVSGVLGLRPFPSSASLSWILFRRAAISHSTVPAAGAASAG